MLQKIGLSASGPVAGALFAKLQALGMVKAGSALATAQSIAMGGSIATATALTVPQIIIFGLVGARITRIARARL